jgi:hypothetical protein
VDVIANLVRFRFETGDAVGNLAQPGLVAGPKGGEHIIQEPYGLVDFLAVGFKGAKRRFTKEVGQDSHVGRWEDGSFSATDSAAALQGTCTGTRVIWMPRCHMKVTRP